MQSRLLICISTGFLAIILMVFSSSAANKSGNPPTARLIELGPADWEPTEKPVKWSPTGAMISYFNDDFLMIADTLGNSHQVDSVDLKPYRYEWVSDDQIIVNLRALYGKIDTMKMVIIDVNSGGETVLAGDADDVFSIGSEEDSSFLGPYLTVQGNAYYLSIVGDMTDIIMPQAEYKTDGKSAVPADNQILRFGAGGLYLIGVNTNDSSKIAAAGVKKAYNYLMSTDGKYLFMDGEILELKDSTRILLDTVIKNAPPEGEGCGIIYPSFNPNAPEILFQVGCDIDHFWLNNDIGIFDFSSGKLTILDTLAGIDNCTTPTFSPDGRKVAFLANDKAYILYRNIK